MVIFFTTYYSDSLTQMLQNFVHVHDQLNFYPFFFYIANLYKIDFWDYMYSVDENLPKHHSLRWMSCFPKNKHCDSFEVSINPTNFFVSFLNAIFIFLILLTSQFASYFLTECKLEPLFEFMTQRIDFNQNLLNPNDNFDSSTSMFVY